MTDTVNLGLPLLAADQAQKHITHNEAILRLDGIVQLAVHDRDLTAPPGGEVDGDRWIVAAGATGAWAGHDHEIALMQDGQWLFLVPRTGWLAWVVDEAAPYHFDGAGWNGSLNVPAGSAAMPGLAIGDANSGLFLGPGSATSVTVDGVLVAQFGASNAVFISSNGSSASLGDTMMFQRAGAGLSITARAEGNVGWFAERYSADNSGSTNIFRKSRGTIASPAVPAANDVIGQFQFQPLTSAPSTYGNAAVLDVINLETTPSGSALGSRVRVRACATGSATLSEVLRIDADAGLSMFGANPVIDQNRLHRLRSYTVATLPTPGTAGRLAYASNCRVFNGAGVQEGAGAGTGGTVVDNGSNWKIAGTNVTAVA